jgi:microcystin synthetase protein McyA
VDLSRLTDAQRREQIERIAQAAQESLHIEEGPVLRVVLFESGEEESGRLLVVIHHLAVDGVSWRILLEEMQELVRQQERGEEEVRLRAASSGYEEWAERIAEYGRGEEIEKQVEYWLSVVREEEQQEEEAESRSVEQQREPQTAVAGAPGVERVSLTAELTHTLLTRAQAAYHTQINDLLLTALLRAWQRTFERPHLLIEMEGHGREDLFSDLDVTRTIGWFTTLYPVRLRLPERAAVGAAIKSIKEQLREVPERGIGYGVLRYEGREEVRERLRRGGRVEVRYNYLGQFDQVVGAEGYLGGASERRGTEQGGGGAAEKRAAEGRQRHPVAVSGRVLGGQLEVEFSYHETAISAARARELAESFEEQLREVIYHCTAEGVGGFTPSDFPNMNFNQSELDSIISELIESVGDQE